MGAGIYEAEKFLQKAKKFVETNQRYINADDLEFLKDVPRKTWKEARKSYERRLNEHEREMKKIASSVDFSLYGAIWVLAGLALILGWTNIFAISIAAIVILAIKYSFKKCFFMRFEYEDSRDLQKCYEDTDEYKRYKQFEVTVPYKSLSAYDGEAVEEFCDKFSLHLLEYADIYEKHYKANQ